MKENSSVSDKNMRNSRHCRESLLSYITLCWPNLSYFLLISTGTVFFLTLEALLSLGWSKELFTSLLPCKATGSGRPDDNFLSHLFKAMKESIVHQRHSVPEGCSWNEQGTQHTLFTMITKGTASPLVACLLWHLGFSFQMYRKISCFDETLQIISHAGE